MKGNPEGRGITGLSIGIVSLLVVALSPVNHRGLHQGLSIGIVSLLVGALSPVNHRGLHQGLLIGIQRKTTTKSTHRSFSVDLWSSLVKVDA